MKRLFLLVASLGITLSVAAQVAPNRNARDDQDLNERYLRKSAVDTPHFQSLPVEGMRDGTNADKYCAAMVGDKIAVIFKGRAIVDNITFTNGTVIFKDGTVISPKGARRALKKGECVDKNGDNM